ncbi:hypothetical protein BHE74_00029469 [Ensete ventricosum]|nr:hypothetical protein BHE74_00029469 [Ensete ventricosum]
MGKGFDGARAADVVAELRETFRSGRTRSLQWRAAQLKALARMIDENEADITAALYNDLAKPPTESILHEVLDTPSLDSFCPRFGCFRLFDGLVLAVRGSVGEIFRFSKSVWSLNAGD